MSQELKSGSSRLPPKYSKALQGGIKENRLELSITISLRCLMDVYVTCNEHQSVSVLTNVRLTYQQTLGNRCGH